MPGAFRTVGSVILRCLLAACVLALTGFAGRHLHWSLDLVAQFLFPSIAFACVVALIASVARQFVIAAGALICVVLLVVCSLFWTMSPSFVSPDAPQFSVLLFNVWYRNQRVDLVADLIRNKNPDVVVLVEATARIRDQLGAVSSSYPYRLDCIDTAGCGVLIFSRSRLSSQDVKLTQDVEHSPLLSLTTDIAGCRMMVFVTHLTRPYPFAPVSAQLAQAAEIGNEVAAWHGAKLLVGDFNAAPWGVVMNEIATRGQLQILSGPGGTWPSALPKALRIPIDHMLAGHGLSFVSREVLPFAGSDHVPVLARVAVTDPSMCQPGN